MKRLIIVTAVIVGIPFFVVHFLNVPEKNYKEIELKYLSNIFVRVKRSNGNIESIPLEEYVVRSEEHTSELQSRFDLVCRLLLEKKKQKNKESEPMEDVFEVISA